MSLPVSKTVDPSQIQNELHHIWESLQTTNTTRASLFNLIFYTQKDHRYAYIQKLANALISKFPARIIFILHDIESKEDKLSTSVSIMSTIQGEFDVACDVIQITASGKEQAKIPFLILPHILPDLPTYLIFGEDPASQDPLFDPLSRFAHRMIFDSETTEHLSAFAKSVLEKHEKYHVDVADLNWARLETWRDLFAATFHSQEHLEKLEKATSIEITYNAQKTPFFCHTQIQAFYLQAWLASQLGWTLQKKETLENGAQLFYKTRYGDLKITLSSQSLTTLPPGLILSVEIQTDKECNFTFKTNLDAIQEITLYTCTPGSCELPCHFLFSKVALGHSLVNEIYHKGTSSHFLNLLKYIQTMNL